MSANFCLFSLLSSQPLQIKSALAVEGLKGYIYVEAFKQQHMKQVSLLSSISKTVTDNLCHWLECTLFDLIELIPIVRTVLKVDFMSKVKLISHTIN